MSGPKGMTPEEIEAAIANGEPIYICDEKSGFRGWISNDAARKVLNRTQPDCDVDGILDTLYGIPVVMDDGNQRLKKAALDLSKWVDAKKSTAHPLAKGPRRKPRR